MSFEARIYADMCPHRPDFAPVRTIPVTSAAYMRLSSRTETDDPNQNYLWNKLVKPRSKWIPGVSPYTSIQYFAHSPAKSLGRVHLSESRHEGQNLSSPTAETPSFPLLRGFHYSDLAFFPIPQKRRRTIPQSTSSPVTSMAKLFNELPFRVPLPSCLRLSSLSVLATTADVFEILPYKAVSTAPEGVGYRARAWRFLREASLLQIAVTMGGSVLRSFIFLAGTTINTIIIRFAVAFKGFSKRVNDSALVSHRPYSSTLHSQPSIGESQITGRKSHVMWTFSSGPIILVFRGVVSAAQEVLLFWINDRAVTDRFGDVILCSVSSRQVFADPALT
ncbi:hypothetical protein EDD18DRAFT_1366905 [Armillaria luteobubalina]|uniref:Uncharacterized protein n=1 Tax=Armillaria luteobubalina TaxID=153913 RepID=A0AA39U1L8_9AGAR|nr:hypothetical protein EDD18DRAFT_1366905 [Armillaria luteobubalina]